MTNLEAKAYFVMRLKDKYKYAKGYTTQREAFERAIEVLEVLSHRCSNCKYNNTCKGVAVEEGNTISFHDEDGYCCMWEASND